MKFLTLTSLFSLVLSSAVLAQDAALSVHAVSTAAYVGIKTTEDCAKYKDNKSCLGVALMTVWSALAVTAMNSDATSAKVELAAIKADAVQFLAGETMTDALVERTLKIRESSDELAKLDDEELALGIISLN